MSISKSSMGFLFRAPRPVKRVISIIADLSFVVVSLSLFARKEDEALISEYIDKLLENYSTYIKIFQFACESLNHELTKEKIG